MTSRRNSDQRELLRSSQLLGIENLLDMLDLSPVGYSSPESWERYCENLGVKKERVYPEGTYSTPWELFPGMLKLHMDAIVDWILEAVPMTPKERELFLAQQTLKLMEP